jgi:4-hydroxybenzoyl-CoA thioesterase
MALFDAIPGRRFEKDIRIRFSHCDPAGIVFYPQYFVLFNGLVEDWVSEALGIPYAELIATRRVGMPTVKIESKFMAISRMGDDVRFGLQVDQLGTRSLTLRLECRGAGDPAGSPRVQVRNVIVTTDLDSHRSIDIPADLRAAIARFADVSA